MLRLGLAALLLGCSSLIVCSKRVKVSAAATFSLRQNRDHAVLGQLDNITSSYLQTVETVHNWLSAGNNSLSDSHINNRTALAHVAATVATTCMHALSLPTRQQQLNAAFRAVADGIAAQACSRPLRLLFVRMRDDTPAWSKAAEASYGSIMLRQYELGAQLLKQGHQVDFCTLLHIRQGQVDARQYDALVVVKQYDPVVILHEIRPLGVPLVYDPVDSGAASKGWWTRLLTPGNVEQLQFHLALWDVILSNNVFVAGAMLAALPNITTLPAYHQHTNYAGFARRDRSLPVRVVTIHDSHTNGLDEKRKLHTLVQNFTQQRGVELRIGGYTGHGWDVPEAASYMSSSDPAQQLGYYMGYSSVDVAVRVTGSPRIVVPQDQAGMFKIVWPWRLQAEHVCAKPSLRLMIWLSLGVPVIVYPQLSYIEWMLSWGYPLVATTIEEVVEWLSRLVDDAALRQHVSELGLKMAKYADAEATAAQWAAQVCNALHIR